MAKIYDFSMDITDNAYRVFYGNNDNDENNNDSVEPKKEYKFYVVILPYFSSSQKSKYAIDAVLGYCKKYYKRSDFEMQIEHYQGAQIINGTNEKELLEIKNELSARKIPFIPVEDKDLNNTLAAIGIMIDERVYDKKKYPSYDVWGFNSDEISYNDWFNIIGGENNIYLRQILSDKKSII